AVEEDGGAVRLRLFSAEGHEERVLDLGRAVSGSGVRPRHVVIGGEPSPGQLAVGLVASSGPPASETRIVDLVSGQVLRNETGLKPVGGPVLVRFSRTYRRPLPGSPATHLFKSDAGELVRLDP